MYSLVRYGMKLSIVEVPNVVTALSLAKKDLLTHTLVNKTENCKKKSCVIFYYVLSYMIAPHGADPPVIILNKMDPPVLFITGKGVDS